MIVPDDVFTRLVTEREQAMEEFAKICSDINRCDTTSVGRLVNLHEKLKNMETIMKAIVEENPPCTSASTTSPET